MRTWLSFTSAVQAGLQNAVSHNLQSRIAGLLASVHVLTALSNEQNWQWRKMQQCTSEIPISTGKVFICSENCVCVWVVGMSTQPHSSAINNQVPEHCQRLICLPVGTRGLRTASVSPLPISSSLKSVGASKQLHLLPRWVTLPLSPPRPLETI